MTLCNHLVPVTLVSCPTHEGKDVWCYNFSWPPTEQLLIASSVNISVYVTLAPVMRCVFVVAEIRSLTGKAMKFSVKKLSARAIIGS